MNPPRQYQPIWNKLKNMPAKEAASTGVSLIAHRAYHARIIKAITKEKWLDYSYKLLNPRIATTKFVSSGSKLTVTLHQSIVPEDFE